MTRHELYRTVRRLEVRTQRLLGGALAGFYQSTLRGRGLAFEEVRAYQPGDDIRAIDWKVTARRGTPFVKVFAEERERTIWVVLDQSPSMAFGSRGRKLDVAIEAAALLALSAAARQDRVGLVCFGRRRRIIPPKRGHQHALGLLRAMLEDALPAPAAQSDTQAAPARELRPPMLPLDEALRLTQQLARQRSIILILSDFLGPPPLEWLRRLGRHHETLGLVVVDPWEQALPNLGLVRWRDSESGQAILVDTGSADFRARYAAAAQARLRALRRAFAQADVRGLELPTDQPALSSLLRHFQPARRNPLPAEGAS